VAARTRHDADVTQWAASILERPVYGIVEALDYSGCDRTERARGSTGTRAVA
jgi:hypothetical protein